MTALDAVNDAIILRLLRRLNDRTVGYLAVVDALIAAELRLLAAQRIARNLYDANVALHERLERLQEELGEAREEIACRSGVVKA